MAQRASEWAKNTSKDTPYGPVSFLEKFLLDPFLTIFDPFFGGHGQAKIPQNAAKWAPRGQKPLVAVRLGHSEAGNHLKWGFARGKSVHGLAIRSV